MAIMDCLKEIIGITQSDCPCITAGLTTDQKADVKVSQSGLYMDDLPGGVSMKGLNDADTCAGFYALASKARDNAIQTMQNDLVIAVNNKYKKDKNSFSGQIGKPDFAQSLGVLKNVQGIRVRAYDISDAVLKISRIRLILNADANVIVQIWRVPTDTVVGTLVKQFPVTVTANTYSDVPPFDVGDFPLTLPFFYNESTWVEYWIVYDLTGTGAAPKDNTLICQSCGRQNWVSPYSDYVSVYGAQLDNPTNFSGVAYDNYSHGLVIDADIRCDNALLFCREYKQDDAIAVTMAVASQFKAGELLIEYVLQSPDVNRYTTMAREYNWGKRNHFRAEYDARMLYLGATIDVNSSNCYVCKNQYNQPVVQGILS